MGQSTWYTPTDNNIPAWDCPILVKMRLCCPSSILFNFFTRSPSMSTHLIFQLRKALSQLQRLSAGANGLICGGQAASVSGSTAASKSAGTQTEFPAAMLEDYVVKNRKRILKLLGIVQAQGSGECELLLRGCVELPPHPLRQD